MHSYFLDDVGMPGTSWEAASWSLIHLCDCCPPILHSSKHQHTVLGAGKTKWGPSPWEQVSKNSYLWLMRWLSG